MLESLFFILCLVTVSGILGYLFLRILFRLHEFVYRDSPEPEITDDYDDISN
jgi:hypothetical protein